VWLVGGFHGWGGLTASGLRDFAVAYGGTFAPLARAPDAGNTAAFPAAGGGSSPSGGGPGFCGCCAVVPGFRGRTGGPPTGGATDDLKALEQAALDLYRRQTGDTGPVRVQVRDFGCHLQADVYKDGRLVKSYVYRYGQWQDVY